MGPHLQPMSQAQAKHANPSLEISANGLRKQGSPSKPEELRHNVLYLPRGAKAAKKMGEQRGILGCIWEEGWKRNITGGKWHVARKSPRQGLPRGATPTPAKAGSERGLKCF